MRTYSTSLRDVVVLEPDVYADERGSFYESWNQQVLDAALGRPVIFVQDNQSRSAAGVLRGIHYQVDPHPQGKLVRVGSGAVYDVAVDLRRSSATFREWVSVELTAENRFQLWIPPGFGHAFVALTDGAELLYKTTDYYAPECDRSIRWDDPDIGIEWPVDGEPILSDKDRDAPLLADADVFP